MESITQEKIFAIQRPSPKLLTLYFLRSALTLFGFPFVFIPLLCKYVSLRYHFDQEGVSTKWGVLFHKQVYLTYARIQDIHVSRGLLERWLGLGTVDIQTASGSASAELSIVGMEEYGEIRDFLYTRMRGQRDSKTKETEATAAPGGDALQLLLEIRDELRKVRETIVSRGDTHV